MASITKAAASQTIVTTGWTNPANAESTTADGVFATATPGKNSTVNGDFFFPNFTTSDIPDGATINSIVITVNWGMTAAVTGGTLGVQLRNNGANVGSEVTQTATTQQNATCTNTSGVTVSDLRNASTLIAARVRCSKGNSSTAMTGNLDFVSITVDYTPAASLLRINQVTDKALRAAHRKATRPGAVLATALVAASLGSINGTVSKAIPLSSSASASVTVDGTVAKAIPLTITATGTTGAGAAAKRPSTFMVPKAPLPKRSGAVLVQGLVPTQSAVHATLSKPIPLSFSSAGTVGSGSTISGTVNEAIPVTGSATIRVDGAMAPAAAITVVYQKHVPRRPGKIQRLTPKVTNSGGRTLALGKAIPISRTITASVQVDGSVAKAIPVGRTATASVRVDGTVAKAIPLTSVATGSVRVDATLSKAIPVAISASIQQSVGLVLDKPVPLVNVAAASVQVDASVAREIPLASTFHATTTASVNGTVNQPVQISRTIQASVTVDATVVHAVPLTSSATASVNVDATVAKAIPVGITARATNGAFSTPNGPLSVTLLPSHITTVLSPSIITIVLDPSITKLSLNE